MTFDSFNYKTRGRKTIKSMVESNDYANLPKYGDFLARYNSNGLLIVEIFNKFYDGDDEWLRGGRFICVESWWNFVDERGELENHSNHPMMMGNGYDTYVANNSEITLLLNKLKEIGKAWDFKEKKLIPLEQ
jgi:hypothetical protein